MNCNLKDAATKSKLSATLGLIILIAGVSCRGDEPVPIPQPTPTPDPISTPVIVFPVIPGNDAPLPPNPNPPDPVVVSTIKPDEWYVVQSQVELIIREFPAGVVVVDSTTGPMKVRAKFSDGKGLVENREYKAPFLYFITAGKPGRAAVDFIPEGVTKAKESEIVRQILTVSGEGPNPPPRPGPAPDPKPDQDPQPTAEHVSLAIVQDTQNISPDTAIVLNALVGWSEFLDAGNEFRLYDMGTTEPKGHAAKVDAGSTTLPAVIVRNKATGKVVKVFTLPLTFNELKTIVGVKL